VTSSSYAIRPVRPQDVPAVVRMVHELAEFERAPEQCHLTEDLLRAALFAPAPALFGHVGVDATDAAHGFALWFLNYSTWEGTHGIYLEDLYVSPTARGSGLGRDLLAHHVELSRLADWPRQENFDRAADIQAGLIGSLRFRDLVDQALGTPDRRG